MRAAFIFAFVGSGALFACGSVTPDKTDAGSNTATDSGASIDSMVSIDAPVATTDASPPDASAPDAIPPDAAPPDAYVWHDAGPPIGCTTDTNCTTYPYDWCSPNNACTNISSTFGYTKFMCEGTSGNEQDDSIYCPSGCCNTDLLLANDGDWDTYTFQGNDGTWTIDESIYQNFIAPSAAPFYRYKIDIRGGFTFQVYCKDQSTGGFLGTPFVAVGTFGVNNSVDQPGDGIRAAQVPAACVGGDGKVEVRVRLYGTDAVASTDEIKYYEGMLAP